MEILIKGEKPAGDSKFNLTDEMLDNDNFIEFYDEEKSELVATFSIDDLYHAVKTFHDKRDQRIKRDKLLP